MLSFHSELRDKLDKLRSIGVKFDSSAQCFVVGRHKKRGLTKFLRQLVPVPRSARLSACVGSSAESTGVEASFCGSAVLQRCGYCKSAVKAARAATETALAQRLAKERNVDKAHGLVIDYQIELLVRYGRRRLFELVSVVDPCVGTLIEQLDALQWSVVATQVPIYQPSTDVATAIDLLATDKRTRRQLHLIEIKASSAARQSADNRSNYERVRGRLSRSILSGLPQSYYAQHQLQLLVMEQTVVEQCDFRFDSACVLRLSPGMAVRYPLAEQFRQRANHIQTALAIKTGRRKRKQVDAAVGRHKRTRTK